MDSYLQLFLLTSLGSILGLVGGVMFLFNKRLSHLLEFAAVPFAAGVLLTVSFLGLLPEAVESIGEVAYLIVLVSFFVVLLFEKILFEIHHHNGKAHSHNKLSSSVFYVIFGDTVHNLIDGFSIGASFLVSPSFGFITAFSSFLHEVPHEVGDFGILLKANWKKANIIKINLVSALATYVGAFSVLFFNISDSLVGVLLSISAGIFLYLGAIDFLPKVLENKKQNKYISVLPVVAGALIMYIVFKVTPHNH